MLIIRMKSIELILHLHYPRVSIYPCMLELRIKRTVHEISRRLYKNKFDTDPAFIRVPVCNMLILKGLQA